MVAQIQSIFSQSQVTEKRSVMARRLHPGSVGSAMSCDSDRLDMDWGNAETADALQQICQWEGRK